MTPSIPQGSVTPKEVGRIASSLSPAAIERLLGKEDGNCAFGPAMQFVAHGLICDESPDGKGWSWSPLGLAIRAHLLGEREGA